MIRKKVRSEVQVTESSIQKLVFGYISENKRTVIMPIIHLIFLIMSPPILSDYIIGGFLTKL